MIIIKCNVGPHIKLDQFVNENIGQRGIYLVYRKNKQDDKLRLIYIEKSDNISESLNKNHMHFMDWMNWAYNDENYLRFSLVTILENADLNICEEALIFYFRPPANENIKNKFTHDDVEIIFYGRKVCQRKSINVIRTE